MREILFRGQALGSREWVYGDLMHVEINGEQCVRIGRFYVDPATVGQYTDMTDKNGKKIFEGDIIKFIWDGKERIDVVEFKPPMFSPSNSVRWSMHKDEIIGNRWDNPELLEADE